MRVQGGRAKFVGRKRGCPHLEHEPILARHDGPHQYAVKDLVILLRLCTAHVDELPLQVCQRGTRAARGQNANRRAHANRAQHALAAPAARMSHTQRC